MNKTESREENERAQSNADDLKRQFAEDDIRKIARDEVLQMIKEMNEERDKLPKFLI